MFREEIERWMEYAQSDLEAARILCRGEGYPAAVFHCQQSLEKALKALYMAEVNEMFLRTHSLAEIAESTSFPKEHFAFLRELTSKYTDSRYPSFPTEKLSEMYDEDYSVRILQQTQELMKWIQLHLKKI